MKADRHKRILELISLYNIETQEQLVDLLINEGFVVTQATVSRDIRELKLVKSSYDGDGRAKYVAQTRNGGDEVTAEHNNDSQYISVIKDAVVSIDSAENILVIKTVPGMAMAVAAGIDSMHIEEILGCIAGDDTIMCVVRAKELVNVVKKRI